MTDFNLQATVRDVLREGGCETFRDYAAEVLARIPRAEYAEALMATLPEYVRYMDRKAKPVAIPTPVARGQHASAKVRNIANAWTRFLSRHITTEAGTQLRLADATEPQVRFYVGLLRMKAAETAATADGFEQIADLMVANKARKVKDLPARLGTVIAKGVAA